MPRRKSVEEYRHFRPESYLKEYYSEVGPENDFLLRFYEDSYRALPAGCSILEVGGGPTIYQLMSASVRASKIVFAEFLPQNRAAIEQWLKEPTTLDFSWDGFFRRVAELAPSVSVAELQANLRTKMTSIVECNLWEPVPVPAVQSQGFDVVSSAFCVECIDSEKGNYRTFLKRLTDFVSPHGSVLLTALENASQYRIGDAWFPAVALRLEDLERELRELGCEIDDARRVPAEHQQGYDGLLAVRAHRL